MTLNQKFESVRDRLAATHPIIAQSLEEQCKDECKWDKGHPMWLLILCGTGGDFLKSAHKMDKECVRATMTEVEQIIVDDLAFEITNAMFTGFLDGISHAADENLENWKLVWPHLGKKSKEYMIYYDNLMGCKLPGLHD